MFFMVFSAEVRRVTAVKLSPQADTYYGPTVDPADMRHLTESRPITRTVV